MRRETLTVDKKPFDAILFDLDGTLVHLPQERFAREATLGLTAYAAPRLGVCEKDFLRELNAGIGAMIRNDGKNDNRFVFLSYFRAAMKKLDPLFHLDDGALEAPFNDYYASDFRSLALIGTFNANASAAVAQARRLASRVILATLPIFPLCAQEERLSWVGLCKERFDLVTDYAFSHYSKPNPAYYLEIARRFALDPARCLMVGNDVSDDMIPAVKAGMQTYLVTDCLLHGELPYDGRRSDFAQFKEYLESL